MNKLWCIWVRKDCKLLYVLPSLLLYAVHFPQLCSVGIAPLLPVSGISSFPFSLPPSLCLLHPSIMHDVQRQEGVSETSRQNSGRKQQEGMGGRTTRAETSLSCLSAGWFDGRPCEERGEKTNKRGCLFFLVAPLILFSSPYPCELRG